MEERERSMHFFAEFWTFFPEFYTFIGEDHLCPGRRKYIFGGKLQIMETFPVSFLPILRKSLERPVFT